MFSDFILATFVRNLKKKNLAPFSTDLYKISIELTISLLQTPLSQIHVLLIIVVKLFIFSSYACMSLKLSFIRHNEHKKTHSSTKLANINPSLTSL